MEYIPRHIEAVIRQSHKTFKVVFLGGPRQVGKTTVFKKLSGSLGLSYVTLDDLNQRNLAINDPALFLQQFKTPLVIDEIQYAPQLFSQIKKIVDESDKKGQYWLTGSQQFSLIKNLQETLVGRVAVLNILGLSRKEILHLSPHKKDSSKPKLNQLFEEIFTGSYPVFQAKDKPDREVYFNSYIQTYLDRDLADLFGINKMPEFNRFIQVCAARTGQVLNVSDLARDCGVSPTSAVEWLNIMERTMQIYLLRPYYSNFSKRLIKSPKLYFLDTGLASYLTRWNTVETLQSGSMAGALFETFVIGEFVKKYFNQGKMPPLYYLRDKDGHEVDLVVEDNGLHLFEIKLSASIKEDQIENMEYFTQKSKKFSSSTVISLIDTPIITKNQPNYIPYTQI